MMKLHDFHVLNHGIIIPNHEIFISKFDEGKFEIQMEKIAALAEAHADRAEALAEARAWPLGGGGGEGGRQRLTPGNVMLITELG